MGKVTMYYATPVCPSALSHFFVSETGYSLTQNLVEEADVSFQSTIILGFRRILRLFKESQLYFTCFLDNGSPYETQIPTIKYKSY